MAFFFPVGFFVTSFVTGFFFFLETTAASLLGAAEEDGALLGSLLDITELGPELGDGTAFRFRLLARLLFPVSYSRFLFFFPFPIFRLSSLVESSR